MEHTFCVLEGREDGGKDFRDIKLIPSIQTEPPYLFVAQLGAVAGEFPPDKDAELQAMLQAAEPVPLKRFRIVPKGGELWFKEAYGVSEKDGFYFFHQSKELTDWNDSIDASGVKSVESVAKL